MRISDWSSDVCSSDLVIFLDVAARHDPIAAKLGQACHDIDVNIGIAIGPGGVVDANGRFATFQNDFAHGDLSIPDMDLAAPANRAGRDAHFGASWNICHRVSPISEGPVAVLASPSDWLRAPTPSASVNWLRFSGSRLHRRSEEH